MGLLWFPEKLWIPGKNAEGTPGKGGGSGSGVVLGGHQKPRGSTGSTWVRSVLFLFFVFFLSAFWWVWWVLGGL